ncbi:hypothetical protein HU200_060949 [Digitaria exilis]|uniref:DWNN domain-containing protein n=1 Tax=Digitaria exilis TaxID=1010633 RepID=A0A835A8A1_9POAL|nr:hypothetical protein HU200_060949 [Digitaria exilis]
MGVVHYRYRSGVQTFSVQVPGAFASVADLKRLIAATGRHGTGRTRGRGPRDGIALCDPRTGEGEALHLEVDMTVDSWVIIMASHWKGRHPLLAIFDDGIQGELVQAISSSVNDRLPAELYCPLCKKVITDAMLTSKCCYDSFCDKCIRDYIIAQSKCICGVEILADDLIPNQTLRSTISSMLSSRGGGLSNGTGNLASSNSSKLDGKNSGHHEKLTCSGLLSKTEATEKTSVKETIVAAGAMKTAPEPICQKQSPPDGVTIVSGKLERKVLKTKSSKKKKKAANSGNGDTNYAEYDCNIPFEQSCYNSSFGLGGLPWGADPYSMYVMSSMASSCYPMGLYDNNVNGVSNLPLHAPGMQGCPAIYYSGFDPRLFQDHEAPAHARLSDSCKGARPRSHKPERYHSGTSTQKGGSRSRGRSVRIRSAPEMQESSIEYHDYYEECHSRKKAGTHPASSPRDRGQHRRAKDSSSFESHDYDEEFDGRRMAQARSRSQDGDQHRRAVDSSSFDSHDYDQELGDRRKGRARSRSRYGDKHIHAVDISSSESHGYDEESHGRRKAQRRSRSQKSSSKHSYKRHAYEGSTSSDEENNFKRRW